MRWGIVILSSAYLVYLCVPTVEPSESLSAIFTLVLAGAAFFAMRWASRHAHPDLRKTWRIAMYVPVMWMLAGLATAGWYLVVGRDLPVVSPIDGIYWVAYGIGFRCLWQIVRGVKTSIFTGLADGLLVGASLFLVAVLTVVQHVQREIANVSNIDRVVLLGYATADVMMATLAVVILLNGRAPWKGTARTAGAIMGFSAISDSAYILWMGGSSWFEHLYLAARVVSLAAAVIGVLFMMDKPAKRTGQQHLIIHALAPYVPMVPALTSAICVEAFGRGLRWNEVALMAAIMTMVVVRQSFVVLENVRLRMQLAHQATHDPLTGVANRQFLSTNYPELIDSSVSGAVVLIDLDDFKAINDAYGHAAGDHLLQEVANRLVVASRKDDVVVRLGGDEFAVFLIGAPASVAQSIGSRLAEVFDEPVELNGQHCAISGSIGVAAGGTMTFDELLHQADLAMYEQKKNGKGGLVFVEV